MEPKTLEKIGLTRNESLVYIALLRLSTSRTGEILKKSGLNSGKIYEILESLKIKGLASESVINNVRHFTAAPPSQLLDYVERKKEEISKDEETVKSLIPELEKIRIVALKEVKAVTYTGLRGIKTATEEASSSLKTGENVLVMGATELKDRRITEFWIKYSKKIMKERIRKKIITKVILSEKGEYFKAFKKIRYMQVKVLEGITPASVSIYGEDKVLIFNYQENPSCILIYDRNIAASFRQFFEQLWRIAKS